MMLIVDAYIKDVLIYFTLYIEMRLTYRNEIIITLGIYFILFDRFYGYSVHMFFHSIMKVYMKHNENVRNCCLNQ